MRWLIWRVEQKITPLPERAEQFWWQMQKIVNSGSICSILSGRFSKEYSGTDGAITISISSQGEQQVSAFTMTSKEKAVFFLMHIPYGIEKMKRRD